MAAMGVMYAGADTFNGSTGDDLILKTESLHHYRFTTREQTRQAIFEYIEVFYNRIRRHARIANQAPADFASQQQFAA